MAKIRTLDEFQNALDKEIAWRKKELSVFKTGAKTNGHQRKPFIRAGVALLYAHWEGFITSSSNHYLSFVEGQRCSYTELKSCFGVFGLKQKLNTLSESKNAAQNIDALDFIRDGMDETAKLRMSDVLRTANLKSEVFSDIARWLDIDITSFETHFKLIDESLVKKRNEIAHGEYVDLSGEDFGVLIKEIQTIMDGYKTALENAASLKGYKR